MRVKKALGVKWSEFPLKCVVCGKAFTDPHTCATRIPKTCSSKCFARILSKHKLCVQCGEIFTGPNAMFCSKKCWALGQTGKLLSDEHRASLSRAKKGKPIKHFIDNQEEICKKISEALRGRPQPWNRGDRHPNYKDGGLAKYARQKDMGRFEYKEWRRQVFERDDWTCQCCGNRGGRLVADHIKPYSTYPDLRYDLSNGRTLCDPCHRKTDTFGGRANRKA